MKKAIIASLFAASLVPALANAFDGTLNFNGEVVASTCQFTGDAGGTQAVALPKVGAASLSAKGNVAGATKFNIALTNCTANTSYKVHFDGMTSVDTTTCDMKNTSSAANAAKNVQVQLLDGVTSTHVAIPNNSSAQTSDTNGAVTFPMYAQYVATGKAEAGPVTATTTFSVVYP